jgi:hypothetical protein
MRSAVAILTSALLVAVVLACAISTCAAASVSPHPCCPKTEVRHCALTLLERTKTTPVAHFIATPPVRIAISIAPAETPLPLHERLTDSEGLHLKLRVLLI